MPVHPSEEETSSHVFDKVAKESSNSSASDHAIHKEDVKTAVDAHKSKGPQIPDKMPAAASKDELKAKAQEMNK